MNMYKETVMKISKKMAAGAVCVMLLLAQTGCMTLLKIGAESTAEDFVTSFIKDFLRHPDTIDMTEYCDFDPEFELTDDQLLMFYELTSDIECKIKKSQVNDSLEKASVYVQLTNVCDISEFDFITGTEEELLEEADEVGFGNYTVKFTLKLDKDGEWIISQMDEFSDLMIDPYKSLVILEEGAPNPNNNNSIVVVPNIASDTISSADLVLNAYIYTTWLDVEMEFPLTDDDLMVENDKAYAVLCVFYFNTPINGTFNADLVDGNGNVVMKGEFHVSNEVTVECDFSAGLAGLKQFDPGKYYVNLYYDGNLVATSGEITIL